MNPRPRRLWVTRTQPQADATARKLRDLGVDPIVAPVLETRAIQGVLLDLTGAEALAFTSRAAVAAFVDLSPERHLPVFAVGETTAAFARQAGFQKVESGPGGDVQALADRIAATAPRPALVVNPTAREPAADLAALLAQRGIAARTVAVYETVATTLAAAPTEIDGVLIHSAKAGHAVADLVSAHQAHALTAYAISDAAADGLRKRGFARILIAEYPDETSLLKRIDD